MSRYRSRSPNCYDSEFSQEEDVVSDVPSDDNSDSDGSPSPVFSDDTDSDPDHVCVILTFNFVAN